MVNYKDIIADIKSQTNIVEVIGEVVPLSRMGRHYLGRCPFHKEKTPSFNVVEDKQFYHCFGCGKSGDVFHFLEEYRQISFQESVRILADRLGLAYDFGSHQAKRQSPHQPLYDIHTEAVNFYHAILMTTHQGQEARDYLYQRGLTDELIKYFKIGLAPDQPDYFYQKIKDSYAEETIFSSGLFHTTEQGRVFDSFRHRIMFPLTDDQGRFIAFSGRVWTDKDKDQAKYKNTRKTSIFNKSYELYHLDRAKSVAKKTKELYLMEGFMDVIAAYGAGIENGVASMGTALTVEHVRHIRSYCQKVVLVYDGDRAGQEAIAKSLTVLEGIAVEIVRLPEQMDPDEFVRKNSPEMLVDLLRHSRISKIEFFIQHNLPENLDNLQAQLTYVESIAKLIASEPSLVLQDIYIHQVADVLPDFSYHQVEQLVNQERLALRRGQRQNAPTQDFERLSLPRPEITSPLVKAERQLFHRLFHHPYLLAEFRGRRDNPFQTKELAQLYQILEEKGRIDDLDLQALPEAVYQMFYSVLGEHLPDEPGFGEVEQLEQRLSLYRRQDELNRQSQKIRQFSGQGDERQAILALDDLIAQRRQMEKEEL